MIDIKQGDCLELMKEIPNESIDCIITSPPYNKSFFSKQKKTNQIWSGFEIKYSTYSDDMPIEEYENWMIDFINMCLDKLKTNGSLFFNHKPIRHSNQVYFPLNFIQRSKAKIYQEIIWDRKNSPNIRNDVLVPCTERIYWLTKNKPIVYRSQVDKDFISEVWRFSPKTCKDHPAPFPLELPTNCINLTTKPNDVVLDPFMGIGTTGVAALNTNRSFIGYELDEKYFEIADRRLNKYIESTIFDK